MANSGLFEYRNDKLIVNLQSIIDIESFEILLKKTYSLSRNKKVKKVDFNLKNVSWFEPFQLSQFSLWLLELKHLGKEIFVSFPDSPRVISFLNTLHFSNFIRNEDIQNNNLNNSTLTYKFNRNKPFYPLTFSDSFSFENLLSKLQDESYFNLIFEEVRQFAVTRKAIILDILIKELADNIHIHAQKNPSNIILSKGDNSKLKFEKKYSPFEKNFFKILGSNPYLEIILSDKGPGINKTLKKAFTGTLKSFSETLNNSNIIEYATFEYSSSRTKEARLKDIQKKLSSEIDKIVPYTGLFQIREIVKKYKGLLIIRSGDSIVSFTTNKNGLEEIVKSSETSGYKSLANFGGTQIKVVLPIINDLQDAINKRVHFRYNEVSKVLSYAYFSFFDYFSTTHKDDHFSILAEGYSTLIEDIQTASDSNNYTSIIVDCKTNFLIDSKLIFLLVCQIMIFQRRYSILYTLTNLNTSILEIINDALRTQVDISKAPIVVFTENYIRASVGFTLIEKEIYDHILNIKEFQIDAHTEFASEYPHLFYVDEKTGFFELRHNRKEILEFKSTQLKNRLGKYITDTRNGIYYKKIKILSPSGKYSTSYYEISNLLNSKKEKFLVSEWILTLLILQKPDAIISIGQHCHTIINTCLSIVNKKILSDSHYSITSTNYESKTPLINAALKNKKVIIFTDVIASGKTLNKITNSLSNINLIGFISIVNLTAIDKLNNKQIYSILHDPITFFDSLPAQWNYEELHTVDKETNKILITPSVGFDISTTNEQISFPLTEYGIKKNTISTIDDKIDIYNNGFLDKIVIPNKAYYLQVYNRSGFMPIMYDTNVIVNLLKDSITQDIVNDIFKLESKYATKIKSLIHLDYENNPFKTLISSLLITYPTLEIIPITHNHLDFFSTTRDNSFKNSGVLILDDAFTTGEALFTLIDYCENRGAKFIFCYILIKRSSIKNANKLLKLRQYGNSDINFKYVFDAQLPVYKGDNNPIIKGRNDILKLLSLFEHFKFSMFLNEIKKRNSYRNSDDMSIFSFEEPDPQIINIRWKLELAKDYLAFRKDLSLLFDNIQDNFNKILILFRILEQEKDIFLNDDFLKGNLFYPLFREKVVQSITIFLNERYEDLQSVNLYDLYTVLIALDSITFFSHVEEMSPEKITDEKSVFPLVAVLSTYNRDPHDLRRYLYIDRIIDVLSPSDFYDFKNFINNVNNYWKSEDTETYSQNASKKIIYIKALLKSCFHDFLKTLNYLTSTEITIHAIIESWHGITKMCKSANDNLSALFAGHLYPSLESEFFQLLKDLSSNAKIGDNLAYELSKQADNTKENQLVYHLVEVAKNIENIVFKNGLLDKIESSFRIEIKQHLVSTIEVLIKNYTITKYITTEECNIFCSDLDFILILKNITENIVEHSGAKNILLEVFKISENDFNFIVVKISDDGPKLGKLIYGDGLKNCEELVEKYSGSFKINFLEDTDKKGGQYFSMCVELKFHDLSKNILNRPKYAK